MRNSREMRREAWGILKGKWFWRLLSAAFLLQLIAQVVNGVLTRAYAALGITTVGDYLMAKIKAAQQGLSYSLPTAKAYYWMAGGFAFQLFIAYIFAAIFAFGFMGLLLKAARNDESRWFAGSFDGFARPLEITWLLALMNLMTVLPIVVCRAAGAAVKFALRFLGPLGAFLGAVATLALLIVGAVCAVAIIYGYRQAWFIKNERPDAPAVECLRSSRRMMIGFKWRAFCLDFSFVGWLVLVALLLLCAGACAQVSQMDGVHIAVDVVSFLLGVVAFWAFVKVVLGMAVARVVFYRELQKVTGESAAGGES